MNVKYRIGFWFICFCGYVLLRLVLGYQFPYLLDDAYITLRYAENISKYDCFCYQQNQSVLGITTIAFPYLLSILSHLLSWNDYVPLVKFLNIFFEFSTWIVLQAILLRWGEISFFSSFWLAGAIATQGFILSASAGGMETAFFMFACLGSILFIERAPLVSVTFSILSLFIRPEGIVLILLQSLFYGLESGKRKWVFLLGILTLLYPIYLKSQFGTFYPSSVQVKRQFYSPPLESGFYLFKSLLSILPFQLPLLFKALFIYGMGIYGAFVWPRKNTSFFLLILFPLLLWILYSWQNPPMWFWYSTPLVLFGSLFFYFGCYHFLSILFINKRGIIVSFFAMGMILLNLNWTFYKKTLLFLYTERIGEYVKVIEKLQTFEGLTESSSILAHEIGAIGYFSKARIIDAVGLINPQIASLGVTERKEGKFLKYGQVTLPLLKLSEPDFVIVHSQMINPNVLNNSYFKKNYRFILEQKNSAIRKSSGNLIVYKAR